jgi:outer membrane lipopolysaccharide assembly protein LptE/RlpB
VVPIFVDLRDRNSDLSRELGRALKVSKVPTAASPDQAKAVLEIVRDRSGREVESISARNRPQEYRVFYSATYQVRIGDEVILTPQNVTRTRIYTYDELEVLAKAGEEALLRQALAREIAGVIARRVATLEPPGS